VGKMDGLCWQEETRDSQRCQGKNAKLKWLLCGVPDNNFHNNKK
jgi:hypothetical protein